MKTLKQLILTILACALFFSLSSAAFASKEETPIDELIASLIGTRYKSGGTTEKGFDCSGFTQYVFKAFGIDLNRTSRDQAREGSKIEKKHLRKGDLVFFNTNGKGISHVGIYLGDGKFAHSSSKNGVTINKLSEKYYVKRYVTARRVLSEQEYKLIATIAEQQAVATASLSVENVPEESESTDSEEASREETDSEQLDGESTDSTPAEDLAV